jgi:hypothetical protein
MAGLASMIKMLKMLLAFVAAPVFAGLPLKPLMVRDGELLNTDGTPVRLYGVNLFQSHLHWSRKQDPELYEPELQAIAENGFNAVRMPLHMGWFEPKPGVFPDSPEYVNILKSHRLPTGAMAFYDGLIQRAGELGIYVIPEFHELPSDPYRYFVGGWEQDRKTGKTGTAIGWMAQWDEKRKKHVPNTKLARREVPKALGWLSSHWRDNPIVAGIEVPWNEPRGPLTEPKPFLELVEACANAVKAADPGRLVFMDCVDWGAMVNRLPDESLWRIPEAVDGLFPHFYPGMHSGSSGPDGTWQATMANWASWFGGAGKVVMVGEYGIVEMKRAKYWQGDRSAEEKARTFGACVAQWHEMGIQGLFCWAWQGGIPGSKTGKLTDGAEVLPRWAAPFKASRRVLAQARLAVVCSKRQRSQYGARRNLWRISDGLIQAGLTPFCTIFPEQIIARKDALKRFTVVIALRKDLPADAVTALDEVEKTILWLNEGLPELQETIATARRLLGQSAAPSPVLIGRASGQATIFLRSPTAFNGPIVLAIPGCARVGALRDHTGTVLWQGEGSRLLSQPIPLTLPPWSTTQLTWHAQAKP